MVENGKLIAIYGQSSATEYAGVYSACVKLVKHIGWDFCTNNHIWAYHNISYTEVKRVFRSF